MGLAAIENQVISWDKIEDNGKYYVEGDQDHIEDGRNGHGLVDMRKLSRSPLICFYNLAYDLTLSGMRPMLENFGFGKKTEFDEHRIQWSFTRQKMEIGLQR